MSIRRIILWGIVFVSLMPVNLLTSAALMEWTGCWLNTMKRAEGVCNSGAVFIVGPSLAFLGTVYLTNLIVRRRPRILPQDQA